MQRLSALIAGAAAGAAATAAYFRRRGGEAQPPAAADPRAEDLRAKLAEARLAAVEEERVEAAERARETTVEDDPDPASPSVEPEVSAESSAPGEPSDLPPADEFEAMRRRVHDEARAAADEMKRSSDKD